MILAYRQDTPKDEVKKALDEYMAQGYVIRDERTNPETHDFEFLLIGGKNDFTNNVVCLYKKEQCQELNDRIHENGGKGFFPNEEDSADK